MKKAIGLWEDGPLSKANGVQHCRRPLSRLARLCYAAVVA
jgi:hypothetical protein